MRKPRKATADPSASRQDDSALGSSRRDNYRHCGTNEKQLQSGMGRCFHPENVKMGPFLTSLRDWGSCRALSQGFAALHPGLSSCVPYGNFRLCSSDFGARAKKFSGQILRLAALAQDDKAKGVTLALFSRARIESTFRWRRLPI